MLSFNCSRWSTGLAAIALLTVSSVPVPAIAQSYQPSSNIGLPGRREGGGTRGSCVAGLTTLTALMPTSNLGLTTQAYPKLYWYVPGLEAPQAEFALYNANDEVVYQTQFEMTAGDQIIALQVPEEVNLPPLEVGQRYGWELSLICNPDQLDSVLFVDGWIERVEPDASLEQALTTAVTPIAQATLYAEAGLWLDALETLADLRLETGDALTAMDAWQTLLASVDLAGLANVTISTPPSPAAATESSSASDTAPPN